MADPEARTHFRLFVPGAGTDAQDWARRAAKEGINLEGDALRDDDLTFKPQFEWVPNDGGFGKAFSFGTATKEEQAAIDRAPSALVLYFPVDLHTERTAIADLVTKLANAGALAVRVEESRLGWPAAKWVKLVGGDDPWSLHRAVVVVLDGQKGELTQSCGMHAFSLPDTALVPTDDREAAHHLLSVLNVYQIAEDPLLLSGQTFSPDRETPKRRFERWPDGRYPTSHACHNPFGVLRLGPPGGQARPLAKLAPTFIPALAALLSGEEARRGRPLSRADVEGIRDKAAVMAMTHADARALERSRGYADFDPELAWEQWQVVRSNSEGGE